MTNDTCACMVRQHNDLISCIRQPTSQGRAMKTLQTIIDELYETRDQLNDKTVTPDIADSIHHVINQLNDGSLRAAEKIDGTWVTHAWVKKAILLFFKIQPLTTFDAGYAAFYDRIPLKFTPENMQHFAAGGVRVVPPAIVRRGAYLAPQTILMPSYVNIGAYVDSGTLVDTWATVGSCAQIGKNVHLSGGVGIGGVLEPLQANPTIIEDDCFIGARSEIVEGVIVEKGAVISMGVYISQSTPIYDRHQDTITYGRVPSGAVVIPGTLPADNGRYHRYAAIIVKQVDEKTRQKVSINELLRDWN